MQKIYADVVHVHQNPSSKTEQPSQQMPMEGYSDSDKDIPKPDSIQESLTNSTEYIQTIFPHETADACEQLFTILGGFSSALRHAMKYMEGSNTDISSYCQLFIKARKINLLDSNIEQLENKDEQTFCKRTIVLTTWLLAMEKIKEQSPLANLLLFDCAHLHPNTISLDVLRILPSVASASDEELLQTIHVLQNYALLESTKEKNIFKMDSALQAVICETEQKRDKNNYERSFSELVKKLSHKIRLPRNCLIAILICKIKLPTPGIRTILSNQISESKTNFIKRLMEEMVEQPVMAKHLDPYLPLIAHVESLVIKQKEQKIRGRESLLEFVVLMNNLGVLHYAQGETSISKVVLEQAAAIAEEVSSDNLAEILTNLGPVLIELGDVQGAKRNLEKALKIKKDAGDQEHPEIITILWNLVNTLIELDKIERPKGSEESRETPQIEEMLTLALSIELKANDSPCIAKSLTYAGGIKIKLGKLKEAEEVLRLALKAEEEIANGQDHPEMTMVLVDLGIVLIRLKKPVEGEQFLRRALAIAIDFYGENHPQVTNILMYLVHELDGTAKNLRSLFSRNSFSNPEAVSQDSPPEGLSGCIERELDLMIDGTVGGNRFLELIEESYKKFISKDDVSCDSDSEQDSEPYLELMKQFLSYAVVFLSFGKKEESKACVDRARDIEKILLNKNSPDKAGLQLSFGQVLFELGEVTEAQIFLKKALEIVENSKPEDFFSTLYFFNIENQDFFKIKSATANSLGKLLLKQGEVVEANTYFKMALEALLQMNIQEEADRKEAKLNAKKPLSTEQTIVLTICSLGCIFFCLRFPYFLPLLFSSLRFAGNKKL
ncbi:MAG: tetratricopeptide repeat protein [Bdellovibrionota bacterium]